jgi:Spy/CpxP family protein refolding chaperone
MSERMTRVGLGIGAALIAIGLAAGIATATQNTNGQEPPFRGGRMGRPPMGLGGPGMGPMGMMIGRIVERLGLSDAQKDQVKTIMQSHADEFKALAGRAGTARGALDQIVMADAVDDGAIRQKSADVAAVEADIAVAGAHVRAEVFQILTAEQKDQLKKLVAERHPGGPGRGRGR